MWKLFKRCCFKAKSLGAWCRAANFLLANWVYGELFWCSCVLLRQPVNCSISAKSVRLHAGFVDKMKILVWVLFGENNHSVSLEIMAGFSQLGIDDWLVQQCRSVGLKSPTPIQQHCTEPILQGKKSHERLDFWGDTLNITGAFIF